MNPDELISKAQIVVAFTKHHNIDLNAINELNQIMITRTIDSQESAHEAVRSKRYIVGSYHPTPALALAKNL